MAVIIENKTFSIDFASNGKIKSIIRNNDAQECILNVDSNDGLYITQNNAMRIDLNEVELAGKNCIKFSALNNDVYVVFEIKKEEKYIAFTVKKINGLSNSQKYSFFLKASSKDVKTLDLDYMTSTPLNQTTLEVTIPDFYYKTNIHPMGSFAIYTYINEEDEDDTLLQIWANEAIPHPNVSYKWNYNSAKRWIENWKNKFSDRTRLLLGAENETELYKATEYAIKNGVKEIYLHTDVWRFEYWPTKNSLVHVNRNVFPNGETDLKKYNDYLKENGMYLVVHNVCGGIGFYDKDYVLNKNGIDHRLASWASGVLLTDITPDTKVIKVCPSCDTLFPYRSLTPSNFGQYGVLPNFFDYKLIRVENELMEVEKIVTDNNVWEITISQRGCYETKNISHKADSEVIGLIRTYSSNLIPDNDSDLIEEIAKKYADFLNRIGISGAEYDGAEIHLYNGSYGYKRFAYKLYSTLDHPVVAHDSGGVMPSCHFEYRFNSVRRQYFGNNQVVGGCGGEGVISLVLKYISRDATIPAELEFYMNEGLLKNVQRFGMQKSEPMFGVSAKMLETYGLSSKCLETLSNWRKVAENINDSTKQVIQENFQAETCRFATPNFASEVIFVCRPNGDQISLIPTAAMTDENTINWQLGVEHGCLYPAQYLRVGDSIILNNRYNEQTPSFYLKVKPDFKTLNTRNCSLMPNVDEICTKGDYQFTQNGDAIQMSLINNSIEERWETNQYPVWKKLLCMKHRKGIGGWIKGDNSGAVVVICVPGGDYPIKIDFDGYRYIEIPDAQYSWRQKFWGWRVETKQINYMVNYVGIHFGYVPPHTNPCIEFKGLTALSEIKSELVNPTISTNAGFIKVLGNVPYDGILHFDGKQMIIRDGNWKEILKPQIKCNGFKVYNGNNSISVKTENDAHNFIEVQFLTEGKEIKIKQL